MEDIILSRHITLWVKMKIIMENFKKTIHNKKYTLYDFIKIPFLSSPILTSVRIIDKIIYALIPSFTALVTAGFINTALEIFAGKQKRQDIYIYLLLIMLIIAHQTIDWTIIMLVSTKIRIKLTESFKTAVVEKRAKLEYRHIENSDTWDLINRACEDPAARILNGFDHTLRIFDMMIRVVSLLFILFRQVWWAGIAIILFSAPLFWLAVKSGKTNYEAFKNAAQYERRAKYLHEVLTGREYTEERTVFGYTNKINEKWFDKFETARKINLKAQLKNYIRTRGAGAVTVLIWLGIVGVLIAPLGNGELTAGMFIGLSAASFTLVQEVSWGFINVTSELADNNEYLKDLSSFAALSEQAGALDLPYCESYESRENAGLEKLEKFEKLEFIGVSFKYPGTKKYILRDCSFVIEKNRHYAFVGINGAGKTTITKLLTGLYPDFEGHILIDGKELSEYPQSRLKAIFTVVYQDFARYYISVRDNIMLGNINDINNINSGRAERAASLINLLPVIDTLPYKLDTPLGKIKQSGVDLSGGEWQRVAIARTLANSAPVCILDEPTASLDPIAESNMYEMFGKISTGKTTVFITHRLGAAKLADEIFVIDGGTIAERGSHTKLLGQNGIYARMFESQRSWYFER